uniref:Uncharacterized protein n=1 Tax=Candidatus Kentrum sp. DK TaxID=2126562 RepID=A0A450RV93_9GAMM|nr:MAG: hypothetical protein BECKDK2373B_GA0170837_100434 [Candidatus Kentron sp. DK]
MQRHVIRRQVLELGISRQQDAHRLQGEFARVYRQRVVPLLDRCCTDLAGPDTIHRIESLEIDLGHVDPDRLEADVMAGIGKRIEAALAARIGSGSGRVGTEPDASHNRRGPSEGTAPSDNATPGKLGDATPEKSLPRYPTGLRRKAPLETDSQLELFTRFARTGTLPWWADFSRTDLPDEALRHLIHEAPDRLRSLLRRFAREVRSLRRIVHHYGRERLAALFVLLSPALARALPDFPRRLAELVRRSKLLSEGARSQGGHRVWEAALRLAALPGLQRPEALGFVRDLLMEVAADFEIGYAALVTEFHETVREGRTNVAGNGLRSGIETLYREVRGEPPRVDVSGEVSSRMSSQVSSAGRGEADASGLAPNGAPGENHASVGGFGTDADEDRIYLGNAGLVILWPFLGHFFGHLGLLTEEKRFRDEAAMQRATGLLQCLVTEDSSPPEFQLPLNKLLCGMELDEVFDFGPPVTEAEAEEGENLLRAAIAQAPILKEMSIPAFRNTFLLRQGILSARDGAWLLRVERETYDVVLDRFPWTVDWIRLPWMPMALRVEW